MSLGFIQDPEIAQSAFEWMLDSKLELRETRTVLEMLAIQDATRASAWDFMTANYEVLTRRIPAFLGVDTGARLIGLGNMFCDARGRKRVQEFFGERARTLNGGLAALSSTLIDARMARKQAHGAALAAFLRKY
jgi:hypothetical protein